MGNTSYTDRQQGISSDPEAGKYEAVVLICAPHSFMRNVLSRQNSSSDEARGMR